MSFPGEYRHRDRVPVPGEFGQIRKLERMRDPQQHRQSWWLQSSVLDCFQPFGRPAQQAR